MERYPSGPHARNATAPGTRTDTDIAHEGSSNAVKSAAK